MSVTVAEGFSRTGWGLNALGSDHLWPRSRRFCYGRPFTTMTQYRIKSSDDH